MEKVHKYRQQFHTPLCSTEDALTELQREFMEKHYHHFEDREENKFIYTDIFKEYVCNFQTTRPCRYDSFLLTVD